MYYFLTLMFMLFSFLISLKIYSFITNFLDFISLFKYLLNLDPFLCPEFSLSKFLSFVTYIVLFDFKRIKTHLSQISP